jgi:hypothetical protein
MSSSLHGIERGGASTWRRGDGVRLVAEREELSVCPCWAVFST